MKPILEELEKRVVMDDSGPTPPTVTFMAGSNPIIGSSNDIQVIANSAAIKSVTYTIEGPDQVVTSQVWLNSIATNTMTNSVTHSWTNGQSDPYQFQDNWDFWWGSTPGNYTVNVHTVYSDEASTSYDTVKHI